MNNLSVIIPCYNEEQNLKEIVKQIKIIKEENKDLILDFILVNNGSTDNTSSELNYLNNKNIFNIVDLSKNLGYGGGILEGIKVAKNSVISWTHGDLQCDLNDVVLAYKTNKSKLMTEKCIVKGKRIKRKFFDAFFSNSMALIASVLFLKKFSEINAQPKIFSREILKSLINAPKDFSLDLFLLYISKKNNFEIIEYPVIYKKRVAGIAKGGDSLKGKLKLTIRSLIYIFRLRFK